MKKKQLAEQTLHRLLLAIDEFLEYPSLDQRRFGDLVRAAKTAMGEAEWDRLNWSNRALRCIPRDEAPK